MLNKIFARKGGFRKADKKLIREILMRKEINFQNWRRKIRWTKFKIELDKIQTRHPEEHKLIDDWLFCYVFFVFKTRPKITQLRYIPIKKELQIIYRPEEEIKKYEKLRQRRLNYEQKKKDRWLTPEREDIIKLYSEKQKEIIISIFKYKKLNIEQKNYMHYISMTRTTIELPIEYNENKKIILETIKKYWRKYKYTKKCWMRENNREPTEEEQLSIIKNILEPEKNKK